MVHGGLGRGGFGQVRLERHQLTDERVALKFLPKSEIQDMIAAERTISEMCCLMALQHPNIITLMTHIDMPKVFVIGKSTLFKPPPGRPEACALHSTYVACRHGL